MTKKASNKRAIILVTSIIVILFSGLVLRRFTSPTQTLPMLIKPSEESFQAPGRDWPSEKKVEDYFVSNLRMTPQEAKDARANSKGNDDKVMLRLTQNTTIDGLLNNLEYYGFVRNKESLRYALDHTTDTVPGHANPLRVGDNTIDIWASYQISENMTAWEIADQLLNHPSYFAYDEYGYMFMP